MENLKWQDEIKIMKLNQIFSIPPLLGFKMGHRKCLQENFDFFKHGSGFNG